MAKRILLVDDEPDICSSLKLRLNYSGYEVDTAENGERAIELYLQAQQKEPYDLIILDIMMPEVNGEEVLKFIRAEEKDKGILTGDGVPIIMLTALKKAVVKSYESGCDDYLVKPFESEDLMGKIKEQIG